MPFYVESMFPEWTCVAISLIFLFAVDVLERVQARFTFFSFKSGGISLEICLTTPHHLSVVFYLMGTIAFDIFGFMCMICKSCMSSILALRDIWVHVCSLNHCNVTSNIKTSVNEVFSLGTTLRVPDINLDYSYVRFRRYFDDIGLGYKNSVIEK